MPNTLHEDGDPVDVMVLTEVTLVAGSVIRCRLIGVLHMEDDGGIDDKLIAMPIEKVDPFQAEIQDLQDLPMRHRERIWHFFEHYKALEQGKWAKISGWGDKAEAQRLLMASIERYKKDQGPRPDPAAGLARRRFNPRRPRVRLPPAAPPARPAPRSPAATASLAYRDAAALHRRQKLRAEVRADIGQPGGAVGEGIIGQVPPAADVLVGLAGAEHHGLREAVADVWQRGLQIRHREEKRAPADEVVAPPVIAAVPPDVKTGRRPDRRAETEVEGEAVLFPEHHLEAERPRLAPGIAVARSCRG